jgi:hypothetical protein
MQGRNRQKGKFCQPAGAPKKGVVYCAHEKNFPGVGKGDALTGSNDSALGICSDKTSRAPGGDPLGARLLM